MLQKQRMDRYDRSLTGLVRRGGRGWGAPRVTPLLPLLLAGVACGDDTTAPPSNTPPVALVSVDPAVVPEGDDNRTVVTLDGSDSSDPDGDPIGFLWVATDGTYVEGTTPNSEVARVTFPGVAPYAIELTVTDPGGATGRASATVGLGEPANRPPVAVIAADPISVPFQDGHKTVVTIDASGSTDPDGDPLTFEWAVESGLFTGGTTNEDRTIQLTFPGEVPVTVTVTVRDGRDGEDVAETAIGVVN